MTQRTTRSPSLWVGYPSTYFTVKKRFLPVRRIILLDDQAGHSTSPIQKQDRLRNKLIELIGEALDANQKTGAAYVAWRARLFRELRWTLALLPPKMSDEEMLQTICGWVEAESRTSTLQPGNYRWLHERINKILDLGGIEEERSSLLLSFRGELARYCRELETKKQAAKLAPGPVPADIDTVPPLEMPRAATKQIPQQPVQQDLFLDVGSRRPPSR